MPLYRVQNKLQFDAPGASNVSVNTWYFETADTGDPQEHAGDLATAVAAFYQEIDGDLSENVNGLPSILVYDMADAEPRLPLYEGTYAITPASTSLPNQLSYVLRYKALYASGVSRARKRGRLFIGPCANNIDDAVGDTGVAVACQERLVGAAQDLIGPWNGVVSGAAFRWQVFSPTTLAGGGSLAAAASDVDSCSVPNRFAVMRSRATAPTNVVSSS